MNDTNQNRPDLEELLTLYVLGEIDADDRRVVEENLLSNPEYRDQHDALREATALIGSVDSSAPRLDAARRSVISSELQPTSTTSSDRRWTGIAAAMLLFVTLAIITRTEFLSTTPDPSMAKSGDSESSTEERHDRVSGLQRSINESIAATQKNSDPSVVKAVKGMVTADPSLAPQTPVAVQTPIKTPAIKAGDAKKVLSAVYRNAPSTVTFFGTERTNGGSPSDLYALSNHGARGYVDNLSAGTVQFSEHFEVFDQDVGSILSIDAITPELRATLGAKREFLGLELDDAQTNALTIGKNEFGFFVDTPIVLNDDAALIEYSYSLAQLPQASGVVTRVSPVGAVTLSIDAASISKVHVGHPFEVFRGGQKIGTVDITEVKDGIATGTIAQTEPGQSFRIGDGAKTSQQAWRDAYEKMLEAQRKKKLDDYLGRFKRRDGETPSMMLFRYWGDNPFIETATDALSTFGMDVDTASYTLTRRYLEGGNLPPKAAVRTEEHVNYFSSNLAAPTEGTFGVYTELAPSYFAHAKDGRRVQLLKIGVKAREVDASQRMPLSLTLVIDVSGSMKNEGRLELVKQAIAAILSELTPLDTVSVVSFNTNARVVIQPTSAKELETIAAAVRTLTPGGSTNVEHGLKLGYELANREVAEDRNNRVVLFSDGVANVGNVNAQAVLGSVAENRGEGIYLNTFGVGMGNHNDELLEQLADRGNGQCAYVDSFKEAVRLFKNGLAGVFETVAKDAKIQVEFDPKIVKNFRQIGYENRQLAHQDFRDDSVDAGEVHAGQEVVALYEIELQSGAEASTASVGTVRVRYHDVASGEVVELPTTAPAPAKHEFDDASPRFRLAACVAAFAEVLRDSYWAKQTTLAEIREVSGSLVALDTQLDDRVAEFVELVGFADTLIQRRLSNVDSKTVDEYKAYTYRCEVLKDEYKENKSAELQAKIEAHNAEIKRLEAELRAKLNG